MSYVRLKHTLSSLALVMLDHAPRTRPIAWLLAYSRLAPRGEPVSLATLKREAVKYGTAGPRSLVRLQELGLLERSGDTIRLAPGYAASVAYFSRQIERLYTALRALNDRQRRSGVTPLERGVVLFNSGLFFECHEYLEGVWRATTGPDRDFYQGIIQAASAFYHAEKDNMHGARMLTRKALRRLEHYPAHYRGVDVAQLLSGLQAWLQRFEAGEPGRVLRPEEFPNIQVL